LLVQPTRAEAMRRRWSASVMNWRGGDLALSLLVFVGFIAIYANWRELAVLRFQLPF